MDKKEALEALQENARDLSRILESFRHDKAYGLADYISIWRAVNFRIQNIIRNTPQNSVEQAIDTLKYDLFNEVLRYQEYGIEHLVELSAIALSAVEDIETEIYDYEGKKENE